MTWKGRPCNCGHSAQVHAEQPGSNACSLCPCAKFDFAPYPLAESERAALHAEVERLRAEVEQLHNNVKQLLAAARGAQCGIHRHANAEAPFCISCALAKAHDEIEQLRAKLDALRIG